MDRDFVRTGSMLEEGAVDEAEFQNEMKGRFWLFFSFVYTLLCWIDYALRYTFLSSIGGDPQSLIDIAPLPLATSEPPPPPLTRQQSAKRAGVSHTISSGLLP